MVKTTLKQLESDSNSVFMAFDLYMNTWNTETAEAQETEEHRAATSAGKPAGAILHGITPQNIGLFSFLVVCLVLV